MSQLTAQHHSDEGHDHAHGHAEPHVEARARLTDSMTRVKSTAGLGIGLLVLGLAGCAALFFTPGAHAASHALSSYHTGFLYCMGLCLGALGMQMIFQQFNAGWSAAVRRQCENIASLAPVLLVLFLPVAVLELGFFHGKLFKWMNPAYTAGDPIYARKAAWLNPEFWGIRAAIYFSIWMVLGIVLYRLSRKQDVSGDKWITARARWVSSWGLLLFGLSIAFASFDWLMALDYHFFSTMFGVYFFAGSMVASTALIVIILTTLRLSGKLGPAFTVEHQHDLGKLLFAFTCFWAYITFCQYFLIWYSNIPEETAYFNLRIDGGYGRLGLILCLGHFVVPFLLLLIRNVKRNAHTLRLVALWMLVMHAVDLYFMVRPVVKDVKAGEDLWVDIAGLLGPVLVFVGAVVWKISTAPLVPLKDPRLHEVVEHKNYV